MTASKKAKAVGLDNLKEVVDMINSKKSTQTLTNWYNNEPELYDLVIKGAVVRKKCEMLIQLITLSTPRIPLVISASHINVGESTYSHADFRAGRVHLIEADSQRVREAIDQFYIFVGDL